MPESASNNNINFPEQLIKGREAVGDLKLDRSFKRVIFCGMGGSIMPAEIISMLWLRRSGRNPDPLASGFDSLNLYIHRGFGLPFWADDQCLVICTSWSGQTQETITSFQKAVADNLPVVAISRGSLLAKLAQDNGKPLIKLPEADLPPHSAIGYMLGAILTLLGHSDTMDDNLNALGLKSTFSQYSDLASKIGSKIPLIYASYQWRYLAGFWKKLFNERAKIHAFANYFPEAAHNELAGFNKSSEFFPIILIDPEEDNQDVQKLEKLSPFLAGKNIIHQTIKLTGQSRFEKILGNYNLAITVSLALARILGQNPADNSTIEEFKHF